MSRAKQTKLSGIETDMYSSGKELVKVFTKTKNLSAIRIANQCYKTSMQAMRVQLALTEQKRA
jgi:hypothetical protein